MILTFESADDEKGKIQFKLAPVFSSVRDKDKFPLILIRAVTQNITNPLTTIICSLQKEHPSCCKQPLVSLSVVSSSFSRQSNENSGNSQGEGRHGIFVIQLFSVSQSVLTLRSFLKEISIEKFSFLYPGKVYLFPP